MVDTEVVLIPLYHFNSLYFNEPWVEFGTCQYQIYIPIHETARSLGEEFY